MDTREKVYFETIYLHVSYNFRVRSFVSRQINNLYILKA